MNYPWGTSPTLYKLTTSSVHVSCRYVTVIHFKYLQDYILIWTCLQCANLRRVSLQEAYFERITVIGTLCYQLLFYTSFIVYVRSDYAMLVMCVFCISNNSFLEPNFTKEYHVYPQEIRILKSVVNTVTESIIFTYDTIKCILLKGSLCTVTPISLKFNLFPTNNNSALV